MRHILVVNGREAGELAAQTFERSHESRLVVQTMDKANPLRFSAEAPDEAVPACRWEFYRVFRTDAVCYWSGPCRDADLQHLRDVGVLVEGGQAQKVVDACDTLARYFPAYSMIGTSLSSLRMSFAGRAEAEARR